MQAESDQRSPEDKSIAIPRALINVAQVTCLLTIAMIEGQRTPYWFIERLTPSRSQDSDPLCPRDPGSWGQGEQLC